MAKALFITEEYVKVFTPIGNMVQYTEIEPKLHMAQDSWVQDVLGSNFYNYLQDQYIAQALTADEVELIVRIKPALAWRVAAKTLPWINYQVKNKGVMSQRGDYADSVELETLRWLKGDLEMDADFYFQRLINWLCENRALFPQYISDNHTDMPPKKDAGETDCGMAFY